MVVVVYLVVEKWVYSKMKMSAKIVLSVFAGLLIFAILESHLYISLLNGLGTILTRLGLSNRITEYMKINSLLSDSSGRDLIYEILIQKIKEKPILGYGIYGEWQFVNYSAHNIYLEALVNFGVIVGGAILISYISMYIKSIKYNRNQLSIEWLLIWGCAVFVRGLVGGTIFSYEVFFLLGYMLRARRERRLSDS